MSSEIVSDSSDPKPDLHELIRRRAEEIYYRSGCIPGRDMENWAQAEKEIREEAAAPAVHQRRTAVAIRVNETVYVGEYDVDSSEGYEPGEFAKGAPVPVRFEGDKMFVKRPNGRELETTIVKKVARPLAKKTG